MRASFNYQRTGTGASTSLWKVIHEESSGCDNTLDVVSYHSPRLPSRNIIRQGLFLNPPMGDTLTEKNDRYARRGALSILVSLYHDFPSQPRGRETFYNPLTLPCLPVDDVWACLWFIPIQKRYITGAGLNVRRQLHYHKTQIWHPLSHVQHCPHNTSLAINYLSCVKIRGTKKLCTL